MGLIAWLVLILSMAFRMLSITRPLLGNFAVYQTAYAMIARFFAEGHFQTIFYPQVNILVNGKPSLHLLYYPVSALIAALGSTFLGGTLDFWGRFQSVLFYGAAQFYLYRLVKTFLNPRAALASLVVFAIAPVSIIYGQSFQHEMATVFFTAAFFHHWLHFARKGRPVHGFFAVFFLSWILLTRPNNLYIALPALYLGLWGRSSRPEWRSILKLTLVGILGVILPALWYFHTWQVSQTANNIYSTMYAQFMVRSSFVSPLVLSGEYYKALLDILIGNVCTPIGFTLLLIGVAAGMAEFRKSLFFILWSGSFLASSLLIPRKLIDHEFYLLHFLLPATPLMGAGFLHVYDHLDLKGFSRKLALVFFITVSFALSMRYALHPAFKTTEEDRHILELSAKVRELTGKNDSRLIVQGTHTLLYYADRYGYPFVIQPSPEISDYYRYMNWQKLSEEKWRARNEALKNPVTYLEYLRKEDQATHFIVTFPAEFFRQKEFSDYVLGKYKAIFADPHVGYVFELNPKQ